ncbi:hypothetical protein [Priestia megaterium]|uniref:hypothetical protein n=1 Tax=Priestia megaterium TaxID=1404 RepID=UPI002EC2D117|nr:hypothetical protein [Priestia megaterium]
MIRGNILINGVPTGYFIYLYSDGTYEIGNGEGSWHHRKHRKNEKKEINILSNNDLFSNNDILNNFLNFKF